MSWTMARNISVISDFFGWNYCFCAYNNVESTPFRLTFLNVNHVICISYLSKLNGKWRTCLFQWCGLLLFALAIKSSFMNSYLPKVAHWQCHLFCDMENGTNLWDVHFFASHWNGWKPEQSSTSTFGVVVWLQG